jgi:hypothetical protein
VGVDRQNGTRGRPLELAYAVAVVALAATRLSDSPIGEVLGFVIGTALGWGDVAPIALAVISESSEPQVQ